ncbi:MAG TPA: efflux RND transporter permease subunit [Chloroflexota bacterium]|nr:efflux RND transporter permease subunit [Chloroflexota bacterium]
MRLTLFSIRNPLLVGVVTVAIACFGVYSYLSMGVGIFPNISFPGVTVVTRVPGADPGTVETQVTKPIEDAIFALPNIQLIVSTSAEGLSFVQVQFTSSANATLIPVDAERVVNAVRSKLPPEAEAPSITRFETSAFPVITVGLSGPVPLDRLQQVAEDVVRKRFEVLDGVGTVELLGGSMREIQVKVDPYRLQAYGLGLNSVQQALQSEHVEVPAGSLSASGADVNVRLSGLVREPPQLGDIIVAQTQAGPIALRDVATVSDTSKKVSTINRVDGVPTVTLTISKLASANTLEVSRLVRQAMAELQPELPTGMQMSVVSDAAVYTQQSFNTIRKTLAEAVLFTGLILLLFLHTWRSTLIVLVAIPTSLLATFGLMNLLGLNLNLISMLALTLSVGILVDDSIVVLENIYRHLGLREPPVLAALNGRNEIGLAAITITMVDVVVYLPISLISDLSGEFIRPFALVITAATLTSLLVSFTLTPLLGSRFLRLEHALKQGRSPLDRFGRGWDAGFDRLSHRYQRLLARVLGGRLFGRVGLRWAVIVVGLGSFVFGLGLLRTGRVGFDLFPSGDQSEVDVTLVMPPATSIETTDAVVRQLEGRLRAYPEVRLVYSNTGSANENFFGATGGDTSRLYVLLTPKTDRERTSAELADDFRQHLAADIPNATLRIGLPNPFGFGGFGNQPIQVAVRGPNPEVLNALVDQVTAAVRSVPGAVDVNNDNEKVQRELLVTVNRPRAADLGVTAQQAAAALRTAVDGTVVSKFRAPGQDDVDVRVVADNASFQSRPENLGSLPLLSSRGTIVMLGQLGEITTSTAPTQVKHVARERSVIVNASAGGRLVGDIQRDVEAVVGAIPLPPGYSITYQGQAQQGGQSFGFIFRAMGFGLVLMYLLMVMLFRSLTLPLSVLMSLPLAVVGSLGAMTLTETPFTLFSLLGFTLLMGLVGKNAILLVDYTDTLRRRGKSRTEALVEAGPTRLRPIVMTTMSVVVALAPLALGIEEGSELLKSAAVVLIGGLLTSTLLTLVFIPAMYTIFDDLEERAKRLIGRLARPRRMEARELALLHPQVGVDGDTHNGVQDERPDPSPLAEPRGHQPPTRRFP